MARIDAEQDGREVLAYLIRHEDQTGFRASDARVNFDAFPPPLGDDYDRLGGAVTWLEQHERHPVHVDRNSWPATPAGFLYLWLTPTARQLQQEFERETGLIETAKRVPDHPLVRLLNVFRRLP
jgi:hypothetical protein